MIKKIGDCENIYSVNPMHLMTGKVLGHIEENNGNKYLVFDSTQLHSTDGNKEVLKKYTELWDGIKNEIKTINGGKKVNMVKVLWKLNLTQMIICY